MKHIKMVRDYKVSHRSGWLEKGLTYAVDAIEGNKQTANKLVNSGWAKIAVDLSNVSKSVKIDHRLNGKIDADNAPSLQEIRQMAKEGKILDLAQTAVKVAQDPVGTLVDIAAETIEDAVNPKNDDSDLFD